MFSKDCADTMWMRYARFCIILIAALAASACTKANPDLDQLGDDNIPRPLFNGSTTKEITTGSSSATFQISGECDVKIRSIIGMAVGVAGAPLTLASIPDVSSLATNGASVKCAEDGTFSFELKSLSALGYTVAEGTTYEILLRSSTRAGISKPSKILVTYSTASGGKRPIMITSGGGKVTDGTATGFSAQIRIANKANVPVNGQTGSEKAFLKTDGTANGFSAQIGVRMSR